MFENYYGQRRKPRLSIKIEGKTASLKRDKALDMQKLTLVITIG